MANARTTPPWEAWRVESLRVTTFPSEVVSTDQLNWWDNFVGLPPETVVSRPKTGQYQAHGDFEGRRLVLQVQPGRIEWNMSPILKADEETVPYLGPLPEVLASFLKVVTAWLPHAPALSRLGFGGVVVQPVADVRSGYLLLQQYLPALPMDPDGSSDLFYQINRPRPSGQVANLRMNRLSRWSVQVAQQVTLTLGSTDVVTRAFNLQASCRLELDINTAPDFGILPATALGNLLLETIDLGREIASDGDIP
jgi:hypothetical protein